MEAIMVDCVQNSLGMFMPRNAIFMCERLCAEFPSEKNLQLLASCYLRNDKAYYAYNILKGMQMPQSRYLFALSCYQMNLLREAESALCTTNDPSIEVPNGAAGHYLLGLIYRYTNRRSNAIHHLTQSLEKDPLLWSAYEELCILGGVDQAHEFFSDSASSLLNLKYQSLSSSQNLQVCSEDCSTETPMILSYAGYVSSKSSNQSHLNNLKETPYHPHAVHSVICNHTNTSHYNTPSPTLMQLPSVVPPPLIRNVHQNLNTMSGDGTVKPIVNNVVQAPRRKLMDEGKLRKVSGRLFSDSAPRRSTRLCRDAISTANSNATQIAGNGPKHSSIKFLSGLSSSISSGTFRSMTLRKGHSSVSESIEEDNAAVTSSFVPNLPGGNCLEQKLVDSHVDCFTTCSSSIIGGIVELLNLLRILGEAFKLSCIYRCQDALKVYLKLSSKQYNTGWVLSQVGRVHFELVDYFEADHAFCMARKVSPYMLEGMDIYSTVLYHLKEEMKLSYLAQEFILIDRLSPQAWCAVGNCYSLQKHHETALKFFKRAIQLDSRFTYAHTLCGHEFTTLEDYENGIKCFQCALQMDERHYNSWYGLGVIYFRQDKFEFADHHFLKALEINPCSSVLMCYRSMACHALKRNDEALVMIEKAISADKKNPLSKYHKASILFSLVRYEEALEELEQLVEITPCESSAYTLMGNIYKRLNLHGKAMFYFGVALDLKPPSTDCATIKATMEKLFVLDELEDDDAL